MTNKFKVTAQRLNVRKSPNKESEILRVLNKDDILESTSSKNGWCRLKGNGYVMEEFVTPVK